MRNPKKYMAPLFLPMPRVLLDQQRGEGGRGHYYSHYAVRVKGDMEYDASVRHFHLSSSGHFLHSRVLMIVTTTYCFGCIKENRALVEGISGAV